MAFIVSYSPKGWGGERWYRSERSSTPYEDWLHRGSPSDTLFVNAKFYNRWQGYRTFLRPAERIVYINVDLDGYCLQVFATFEVDATTRTASLDRLLCECDNRWSDKGIRLGKVGGGVSWLKANMSYIGETHVVSFEHAVKLFFGDEWTAVVPMTRPRISEREVALCRECDAMVRTSELRWGKSVAMYSRSREDAAVTIQRHFRGWCARMHTTFNPHTRIGAYYAMRAFDALRYEAIIGCVN